MNKDEDPEWLHEDVALMNGNGMFLDDMKLL